MTKAVMLAAVLGLLTCGCSSFNKDWKAAEDMTVPPGEISGRWEGTWKSEVSKHSGNLKCIIRPAAQTGHYEALYHAKYAKILGFTYAVELETKKQGEVYEFTGSADLGKVGGVYKYEGHVDRSRFLSTYTSKDDHGTFEMLKISPP